MPPPPVARAAPPSPSLLSPSGYDDDVGSVRSLSDQDSDSEDDEILQGSRSTLELARHDQTVLEAEEELERLLTKSSPSDGLKRMFGVADDDMGRSSVRIGKREKRRRLRQQRRAMRRKNAESSAETEREELMYEMEEGGMKDDSSSLGSSTTSVDSDSRTLDGTVYKEPRGFSCRVLSFLFTVITVLFLILYLGAYKASGTYRASHRPRTMLSNGTSIFGPTTVLISLDGFRADFLARGITPTLNSFVTEGISPRYMLPSFPSVTFPNHFTLVTGLYPESHGVVGNTFWDPELQEDFYYTDPERSMQPKWWNAEPLWVTAEIQGVRTAIHMWPGSEAHIGPVEPTYLDDYNGDEKLSRKVDRLLELLDLPGDEDDMPADKGRRPHLLAAYVPNVDADGHKFGPNSTEIRSTISNADKMLEDLFQGIRDRNLTDIVNVVVVSDHGMATTSTDRLIQLDDLVDLDLIDRIDGWPLRGLRPKLEEDTEMIYSQLVESTKPYQDAIELYKRDTMPERYHFSNNDRIAPIWVIPKTGWAIVEKPEWDVEEAQDTGSIYHPRGVHGYDHEHPLMRAIFVARGPKFPHNPNSRVDVFQNTEIYNIVCDSLEIDPHPNNGTLRLPLNPVGLHSDPDAPSLETPPDDPPAASGPTVSGPSTTIPATSTSTIMPTPTNTEDDDDDSSSSLWDGVLDKLESIKDWASGLFGSQKSADDDADS